MDAVRLTEVPLFEGVAAPVLELLSRRGVPRRLDAGAVVWRSGDPPRGLYVLMRGTVRAVRERDGREVVIHRSGPGSTLGEIPLFDGRGYPATLLTETPAEFLVVDRALLDDVIRREPRVAVRLLETLGTRVRDLAGRLEAVVAGSVEVRLSAWVLERSGGSVEPFGLGMTQEALAGELGTVREIVARGLSTLVADGVLRRAGRSRYAVADRGALERRARLG